VTTISLYSCVCVFAFVRTSIVSNRVQNHKSLPCPIELNRCHKSIVFSGVWLAGLVVKSINRQMSELTCMHVPYCSQSTPLGPLLTSLGVKVGASGAADGVTLEGPLAGEMRFVIYNWCISSIVIP